MVDAVVSMVKFLDDETMLEPDNWNRSNYCGHFRRRPDLNPENEFEAK